MVTVVDGHYSRWSLRWTVTAATIVGGHCDGWSLYIPVVDGPCREWSLLTWLVLASGWSLLVQSVVLLDMFKCLISTVGLPNGRLVPTPLLR